MSFEILQKQLDVLQTDLKGFFAKADEEKRTAGAESAEVKQKLADLVNRMNELDMKLVQLPQREVKTFNQLIQENESVQRLMKDKSGRAVISLKDFDVTQFLDRKTTITSSTVGFPTSGVMPEERGAYVPEARKKLRVREIISARPTTLGQLSWPKASDTGTKASPVAEANLKAANNYDPAMVTERVKTIATYFDTSRQVLEDWVELEGILRNLGSYKVNAEFDRQCYFGDNTGENLNGLTTQAQSFDTALLPSAAAGYTYIDVAAAAFQQIDADDEVDSDFIVLNTSDWWRMRRTKDSEGKYILGDPQSPIEPTLWGRRVATTNQMTSGSFLAGSSSPLAAEIRDRMGLEISISTEHGNNFTYNMVTIRFELRAALAVYRPNAYVYGSLVQSPA